MTTTGSPISGTLTNYQYPRYPQLNGQLGFQLYITQQFQLLSNAVNLLVAAVQEINPSVTTFADLPVTPWVGMLVPISDSTTTTWGANITTGGGADTVLAHWNGSNWTVAAK